MGGRVTPWCVAVGVVVAGLAGSTPRAWHQVRPAAPPGAAQAQEEAPPVGTGAISGVVTDGETGQPIPGAIVSLSGAGRGGPGVMPRQMTDARGRFIFTRLPAFGDYTLAASKEGYFDGWYKETPGLRALVRIEIRDGEWLQNADVSLWRPAAISGTVRDERGDPLVGVPVRALLTVRVAGRDRWASGPVAVTDDRGMYRLSGLRAGAYIVQVPSVQLTLPGEAAAERTTVAPGPIGGAGAPPASSDRLTMMRPEGEHDLSLLVGHFPTPLPGSGAVAYPMAFHPTARVLTEAAPVIVDHGDERTDVDVQMQLVPAVRVSGRVTGGPEVVAGVPVRMMPVGAEDIGPGAEAALTMTDAEGAFTFLRVPAGDYVVVASSTQASYSSAVSGSAVSSVLMPQRANLFSPGSMSSGTIAGTDEVRYTTRSGRGTGAFGRIALSVGDQDVTGLAIPVQAGVVVSGHFLWDGSPDPPAGTTRGPLLRLEPASGDLSMGMPFGGGLSRPGGNEAPPSPMPFSIERVLPGRYVFGGALGAAGFTVSSIEYAGRDLLQAPLVVDGDRDITGIVVHLTSQTMSLTGYVRDANGAAAEGGAVIFFPTDRAAWQDYGMGANRFKTATITSSGSYRAPALVPGEYFLAAVTDAERHRWTDPEFLATVVGRATRVTIAPGTNLTQDLTMSGGR